MPIDFKLFAVAVSPTFYLIFPLVFQIGLAAWDHKKEKTEFKNVCLSYHNLARLLHGVPPLKWEDKLYESAQAWANYLNTIQKMEHDSDSKFGSNIFQISDPKNIDLICIYAITNWYGEAEKYDFNKPGYSSETGHFTQMVWKDTEVVAIGEAGQADGNFYLVAEYYRQGNYPGEYEENVLPLRKISLKCIDKLATSEYAKKVLNDLKLDSKKWNDYFYEGGTCVIPTKDSKGPSETSGDTTTAPKGPPGTPPTAPKGPPGTPPTAPKGPPGTEGGNTGPPATPPTAPKGPPGTEGGNTGPQQGTTGSGPQTTYAATPEKILLVPVNEPAAGVGTTPEIILAPAQPAPQTAPEIIIAPTTNLPAPTQPLPVAPEENGSKAGTPNVQTTSISTSVSLNSTVYPSSSLVSPTATKSISVSTHDHGV